jgi:hypothetical protein
LLELENYFKGTHGSVLDPGSDIKRLGDEIDCKKIDGLEKNSSEGTNSARKDFNQVI